MYVDKVGYRILLCDMCTVFIFGRWILEELGSNII